MIAILGATGTIGGSLARRFAQDHAPLVLFARDPRRLAALSWPPQVEFETLDRFAAAPYELVVNAIGVGDPERVASAGAGIVELTRKWDERVLDTMEAATSYVFVSSGIVYGTGLRPGGKSGRATRAQPALPPYTVAKLEAEARHRGARGRSILDVRVFGYADAAMPLDGTFFLSDLARSIVRGQRLATTAQDMVRDYAGAEELAGLIACWRTGGAPNIALDLYTRAPVSKSDLLTIAQARYGLRVDAREGGIGSPTGDKSFYASTDRSAAAFGYEPRRTAAEVVTDVIDAMVAERRL